VADCSLSFITRVFPSQRPNPQPSVSGNFLLFFIIASAPTNSPGITACGQLGWGFSFHDSLAMMVPSGQGVGLPDRAALIATLLPNLKFL